MRTVLMSGPQPTNQPTRQDKTTFLGRARALLRSLAPFLFFQVPQKKESCCREREGRSLSCDITTTGRREGGKKGEWRG